MKAFISYNETCTYMLLLPPENEVCEGYVFTRVCHSGVGVICLSACLDTSPQEQKPHSQEQKPQSQEQAPPGAGTPQEQAPPRSRHPPGAYPSGSSACWEIRPTSGRHASYWNAFLFLSNHTWTYFSYF